MSMKWVEVGSLDDIPSRGARCVNTPDGKHRRVSHGRRRRSSPSRTIARTRGGRSRQGIVHGTSVTCPLHNWVISLETGRALGADEGAVRTVPVRIEAGRLFIALGGVAEEAA